MTNNISNRNIILVAISALVLGLLIGAFLIPSSAKAATPTKEITIKTSAICEMCKDRIEKNMKKVKGVEKAVLDLNTKNVTVTYYPEKITPDEIHDAINAIGYDADNKPADARAYKKLPKCCKK